MEILNDVVIPFIMLLLGLVAHFCKAMMQIKLNTGNLIHPKTYFLEHPYSTILAFVGALAGFGLLYGTEELTRATAFGIGFMADSAADLLGQRSKKKLEAK